MRRTFFADTSKDDQMSREVDKCRVGWVLLAHTLDPGPFFTADRPGSVRRCEFHTTNMTTLQPHRESVKTPHQIKGVSIKYYPSEGGGGHGKAYKVREVV